MQAIDREAVHERWEDMMSDHVVLNAQEVQSKILPLHSVPHHHIDRWNTLTKYLHAEQKELRLTKYLHQACLGTCALTIFVCASLDRIFSSSIALPQVLHSATIPPLLHVTFIIFWCYFKIQLIQLLLDIAHALPIFFVTTCIEKERRYIYMSARNCRSL